MKRKDIILFIVFICLFLLGLTFATLITLFILDILNGPFILLLLNIAGLTGVIVARVALWKHKIYFRIIPWGVYLVFFFILSTFAYPIETPLSIAYYKNPVKTEELALRDGKVVGYLSQDKTVEMYAGIPYAKAPVGNLRFKEPVDPDKWEGVRDCTHFASRSMQNDDSELQQSIVDMYAEKGWHPDFETKYKQPMSEDSLYLNIWKPVTTETNLPILVYIHGGALIHGRSSFEDYNGETFAKNGVIMITITYRLGVFGYMAHPLLQEESPNHTTGNYGLLDQIKALEWVNKNAPYFGGDPNNITIAGESAGSSSVSAICISPLARDPITNKPYFKRAIGESSNIVMKKAPHTIRSMKDALDEGQKVMDEFNVKTLDELRRIPADKLNGTITTHSSMTYDGYAIPNDKSLEDIYVNHENNEEALLNGYNVKEADAFYMPEFLLSPTNKGNIEERMKDKMNEATAKAFMEVNKEEIDKDAFSAMNEIMSVFWFIHPHHVWSNLAYNAGIPVYRYQFTKENGFYGTYHSGEMAYAYGNLHMQHKDFAYNQSDYNLSKEMVRYWTNFAKYGDPNGLSLEQSHVYWNTYNPNESKPVLELGSNIGMFSDKYLKMYKVLEENYYNNI